MMRVVNNCVFCGQYHEVRVPINGFYAWQKGAVIQNAMPEVSATDREFLISGICPVCQKTIFGEQGYKNDKLTSRNRKSFKEP